MKDFLEKIKTNSFLIIVAILIIVLIGIGYQCGVVKEAKRTAEIFEKRAKDIRKGAEQVIKQKEKENEQLEKENIKKDKIITEREAENEKLISQREEDKRRLAELQKEIQKAPPIALVEITKAILVTDEVHWSVERELAEFSLAAFRANAAKLVDWKDFKLRREPNYVHQIINDEMVKKAQVEKMVNFVTEIGNLKVIITKNQENFEAFKIAFDELKRYKKKGNWLEKILWGLAGFGIGKVLD